MSEGPVGWPTVKELDARLWADAPDPLWEQWRNAMPDKHWVKTDLSTLYMGYVLGREVERLRHAARLVLPLIGHADGKQRDYIPLPGGWEVQTKGTGSSFRICDTKTGERVHVIDDHLQPWIERMAREIHAAVGNSNGETNGADS